MKRRWNETLGSAWWAALPVAVAAAVWWPITLNYFFADDLLSVYDVVNKPIAELLLLPYGGHLYVVRNAVYLLLYKLFGPTPEAYYAVALLTHLVNVALLCTLIRRVTDSALLACFGGVLWGTTPVSESIIGWYSVFGHALATTLLLIILNGVVRAGLRGAVATRTLVLWPLLVLAAGTCFGIGIALAVVLPVAAFLLMPPGAVRRRVVTVLGVTGVLVPALYFSAQRIAARWYGSPDQGDLLIALISAPFALADLVANMVAYGTEQLVLGPMARQLRSLAYVALVAAPVLAVTAAAWWRARWPARRAMLAFVALALAPYGIIAIGRAAFYDGFRELIVRSDRYHYAAPAALTVLFCIALAELGRRRPSPALKAAALGTWLLVWVALLALVRPPINHFRWARTAAEQTLASIDALIAAAPPGEDVYIENQLFRAVGPFVLANPPAFPGWAALFAVYHESNVVDGRRVFFVEADPVVLTQAARGIRSAPLLVSAESVPAERVRRGPPPGQRRRAAPRQ